MINNHTYIIPHLPLLWDNYSGIWNSEKFEDTWDVETSMVLLVGAVNVVQVLCTGGVLVLSFDLVFIFLFTLFQLITLSSLGPLVLQFSFPPPWGGGSKQAARS